MHTHRTRLLALIVLLVAGALTTGAAVLLEPSKVEAATYIQTPNVTYGTVAAWGVNGNACRPAASAQSFGPANARKIREIAWYSSCRAANYKGVCARLWRNSNVVSNSTVCEPADTGTTSSLKALDVACTPGLSYTLEMMFLTSSSMSQWASYVTC